jgi:signal peptidase
MGAMSSSRDGPSSDEDERTDSPRASSELRSDGAATDGGEREEGTGPLALVRRFRQSDNEVVVFVREMLSSAAIVLAIGLLLFAISGVWPPMVAIESGSMEPQMQKGDLVFIMDKGRLVPDAAQAGTGVVTYQAGQEAGYESFNDHGDVIIYEPDGRDYQTPIIHRAMFWVEEGDNWYDEAEKQHISADSCEELTNCPAPNSGFITKGDNNQFYDQSDAMGPISDPVKPSWVRGTAEVRVPWLGWVRLQFSGAA